MGSIKILQLNAWSGRIKDGLSKFIADGNYDVVCLQEAVWSENDIGFVDLFMDSVDKIKAAGGFVYETRVSMYGIQVLDGSTRVERGNVVLSKIPFKNIEEIQLVKDYRIADSPENFRDVISYHRSPAQKITLENGLTILNYHGYWLKDPLGDETSVECMRRVADMIKNEPGPVVMCGDLNVTAEAPAMRELDFLTDLTAINNVKTTLRNIRFKKDVACDHILVTPGLKYHDFEVINAPVSDHCALTVTIDLD
ncbi:MAG: endonuclease/exonuclease/phosphatase family protein [Candidatus Saccharibacteria bacterium]|nr:endonuclease/exonuclease/phosphatase family protein [Candidatus Saccharibacteria bacterium]